MVFDCKNRISGRYELYRHFGEYLLFRWKCRLVVTNEIQIGIQCSGTAKEQQVIATALLVCIIAQLIYFIHIEWLARLYLQFVLKI